MGGHEHGFYFGSTSEPKEQGLNICGCGSILEDGLFYSMQQTNYATHIAELYFREVMMLHGIPRSIVSNRDTKFFSHF